MLKKIEALQSGGAWAAAIKGSFPQDITTLEGAATFLPADVGAALVTGQAALDAFKALQAGDANSIIGVVVAAIKGIVNAITKAADQRAINWAEARVWYLANACGLTKRSNLRDFWSDHAGGCELTRDWAVMHCRPDTGYNGFWRFPRASVAEDRPVPYWDPLGTAGNMPPWLYPGGAEGLGGLGKGWGDAKGLRWPAVGNWLPEHCENWSQISLGASCTVNGGNCSSSALKNKQCETPFGGSRPYTRRPAVISTSAETKLIVDPDPLIFAAPWAFPCTCPARVAGKWGKGSNGPEAAAVSLYMLPTFQHIVTKAATVAQWKKVLLLAMERFHPKAYEAEPGNWRTTGGQDASGPWVFGVDGNSGGPVHAPDAQYPGGYYNAAAGPGNTFSALAEALARIRGFEECRAAIMERPDLLPDETSELLALNSDFDSAEKPPPKRKGRPPLRQGRPRPSSGGSGLALAGLLALAWKGGLV